ncbi:MAG TPA: hypothetical protein VMG08_13605 [Allosphingosinicella sp.]|nr:hypothetical protein [Allosphingosinicella sp.]
MRRSLRLGLAAIVASAALTSSPALPAQPAAAPQTAAQWRQAARADIEAAYARFHRLHPGMHDPRGRAFATRLRAARATGLRAVAAAGDQIGYRRALSRFTAALHDGHAGILLPPLGRRDALWPGFVTVWRGGRLLVAEGSGTGPPRGAEVLRCDGMPVRQAIERQIFALSGRQAEAGQWEMRAPFLFMRTPLTAPDRPGRCTFRDQAGRGLDHGLAWSPMPEDARRRQAEANAGPRGTIGLSEPRPGGYVIALPSFDPDAAGRAAYDRLFAALAAERERLAAGRFILIDLRHNGGGDSDWGERVAGLLWGEQAVQAAMAVYFRRTEIWWRTEPENIERLRGFATAARDRGDASAGASLTARADAMAAAAARGEPLFVQRIGGPGAEPSPAPRRLPPVYVLIHGMCASACLDAVDIFLRFPGVRLIGAPTSADSDFMEIMIRPLPSGRASLVVPNKIWVNRPRASGTVYRPDVPVHDLIWSTDLFLDRIERDLRR